MEGQRPPIVLGYPRPHLQVDPRKLEMLRDAYFGAFWLIASTPAVGLGGIYLGRWIGALESGMAEGLQPLISFCTMVAVLSVNMGIAQHYAGMVAKGGGRSPGYSVGLALFATILTPCTFGLAGCAVLRHEAAKELVRAGAVKGLFGFSKAGIQARIEAVRSARQGPPADADLGDEAATPEGDGT